MFIIVRLALEYKSLNKATWVRTFNLYQKALSKEKWHYLMYVFNYLKFKVRKVLYTFFKLIQNFMLYRCLIKNKYGAVISALSPALLFLCVFMLVLVRLYQSNSWKLYDDIYAGRLNDKGFVLWLIVSLRLKC